MRAMLVVVVLAGCVKPAAVTCAEGSVCAPDHVCDEVHHTCVFPDQLETCKGLPDGTLCNIRDVPGGTCKDEVCIPATCGDELVTGDEVCDGANDIPEVGTCVDFSYDYGPLGCNALCTEGFSSCKRLGWQLRTLNGVGGIGGIWEDGDDLWLANQNGIIRRHAGVWEATVQPTGANVWYRNIWAGGGHAFAVANNGSIAHFDGTAWTSQQVDSSTFQFHGVWGRSPTDVYAVGGSGVVGGAYHFDGNTWSMMTLPGLTRALNAVFGVDGTVYAVGNEGGILQATNALSWTKMTSPTSHDLTGIWGSSANNLFAVGNAPPAVQANATIVHYTGPTTGWAVWTPPPPMDQLNAISGRAADEIYAVGASSDGGSNILYFDGESWTQMISSVTDPVLSLQSVHAGASGVYAAKRPDLFLEYKSAGWAETTSLPADVRGIWALGTDYAVAVGDGLAFQEFVKGAWQPVGYPVMSTGGCWDDNVKFVHDVWGTAQRDVWMVGPYGWMLHKLGSGTLSCVHIANGKWITDIWGSGPTDVFAVGADGAGDNVNLLHYDGSMWTDWSDRAMPFATSLSGVWGFSSTNVYAVGIQKGVGGKVLHYDGATWSDAGLVTTEQLHAVWGSSPTDVFVVGTHGAIFHYNGTAWTPMFVPVGLTTPTDDTWVDIHGTGPNDVYVAGSRTLMRYDGKSWAPVQRLAPTSIEALWAVPGTVFTGGEAGVDARLIGSLQ